MRSREQAAERRVAALHFNEERDVGAVFERHLGAGDGANPERAGRVREFERAVDAVVVCQRQGRVPELGRSQSQLLGQRSTVQKL